MKLAQSIKNANRVYLCGNGGSAANAMHIANDLIACGIKAQALTADVATLTAIANDYGYEVVFSRQLRTLGEPGDLLIALSGSGRSKNIIAALKEAAARGMRSALICGLGAGEATVFADEVYRLGENMQAAEAAQIAIGHQVREWLLGQN